MNYIRDKNRLLAAYFLFYAGVMLFFALDQRLLSQYRPYSFHYNRDLTELLLIGAGIPRFAIAHGWFLRLADVLVLLLPAALLGYHFKRHRFSISLGIAFSICLTLHILLTDIFEQSKLEPYMLYVFLALAFMTNREDRFYLVLRWCRYYFLYVFASAALWKICRGAGFNGAEMSNILLFQNADYLAGDAASGFTGRIYISLINHPALSYCLYLGSILLEAVFIVGFFTRRWDRWLIAAACLFVVADCWLMRIPYWTILLGTITLWIGRERQWKGETVRARA